MVLRLIGVVLFYVFSVAERRNIMSYFTVTDQRNMMSCSTTIEEKDNIPDPSQPSSRLRAVSLCCENVPEKSITHKIGLLRDETTVSQSS